MPGARAGLVVATVAALAALASPSALADSDPASDFLPTQNVFLPYRPTVPAPLQKDLQSITALAAKSGSKIKVAIIATPTDLGGVPNLFNRPTEYAAFLGREISFNGKQPLLVVMPIGLGTYATGPKAGAAIAGVKVLSEAEGHPIRGFKPSAKAAGGSGSGASAALIFGVPLGLLVLVLAILTYRRAAGPDEEGEEDETQG